MKLPTLPEDKANHLIYGMVICLIVSVGLAFLVPKTQASLIGFFATMLIAGGKEFLDARANRLAGAEIHDVEVEDFIMTVAGGLLVLLARSF